MAKTNQAAFILRIAPGGKDKMLEALGADQIIIGWAEAEGLLDPTLTWEEFREIVRAAYYRDEPTLRKAGAAAGHMWRFIRAMKAGDLVVVPYGAEFFVAEIIGQATYDSPNVEADSAYRRLVRWLNEKKSIPRQLARAAFLSRMKIQGTSADATDLFSEIKECLTLAVRGKAPTFQTDLQARLVCEVVAELRSGRIESFGFERLIGTVLQGLGAKEVRIIPRSEDKGTDLVATFRVAGAHQFENRETAMKYAFRVFRLRMLAVKNSQKRLPESAERRKRAGTLFPEPGGRELGNRIGARLGMVIRAAIPKCRNACLMGSCFSGGHGWARSSP